jgi:hypothetical protein
MYRPLEGNTEKVNGAKNIEISIIGNDIFVKSVNV